MGFNLGAGLQNALLNAPQLLAMYQQGFDTQSRYNDEAELKKLANALTAMSGFGGELEGMVNNYQADLAGAMNHPDVTGATGGLDATEDAFRQQMKASEIRAGINAKYQGLYGAAHQKYFANGAPEGVHPPPGTWIDGEHELPHMTKYLGELKRGMDMVLTKALAAKDPIAAAKYQMMKQEEAAKKAEAAGFGAKLKSGADPKDLLAEALASGNPEFIRAAELLGKKPDGGEFALTHGGGGMYRINKKTGATELVAQDPPKASGGGSAKEEKEQAKAKASELKDAKKELAQAEENLAKLVAPSDKETGKPLEKNVTTAVGWLDRQMGKKPETYTREDVAAYEKQREHWTGVAAAAKATIAELTGKSKTAAPAGGGAAPAKAPAARNASQGPAAEEVQAAVAKHGRKAVAANLRAKGFNPAKFGL